MYIGLSGKSAAMFFAIFLTPFTFARRGFYTVRFQCLYDADKTLARKMHLKYPMNHSSFYFVYF